MKKFLSVFLALLVMLFCSPAFAGSITPTGMNQGDLYNLLNNLHTEGLTRTFTTGGLAIGSTTTSFQTANTLQYSIAGVAYSKTAADSPALTASAQATDTYCLYLLSINAAGTMAVTKGVEVATDTAILPALPASSAPFGYIKVVTSSPTTFTFGTTALSAAGVTETYYNLSSMPSGPSRIGMTGW